jgi:hypothetical protein
MLPGFNENAFRGLCGGNTILVIYVRFHFLSDPREYLSGHLLPNILHDSVEVMPKVCHFRIQKFGALLGDMFLLLEAHEHCSAF